MKRNDTKIETSSTNELVVRNLTSMFRSHEEEANVQTRTSTKTCNIILENNSVKE